MKLTSLIARELSETARRPARMLNAFNPRHLARYLEFQRLRWLARGDWKAKSGEISMREMGSYDEYLQLQRSKLQYLDLSSHEARFRKALRERLERLGMLSIGSRVLCLGARLGGEVAAFRDLGCFAVGVDLNPGANNAWVLFGDFHRLEFPDSCVDVVYSNSLDHCLEPAKVLSETNRLLVGGGHLIVEADPGAHDPNGTAPDMWATFQWSTVEALRSVIEQTGFVSVSRANFEYPRNGTQLLFRSNKG